jgi:hypothetical protein
MRFYDLSIKRLLTRIIQSYSNMLELRSRKYYNFSQHTHIIMKVATESKGTSFDKLYFENSAKPMGIRSYKA